MYENRPARYNIYLSSVIGTMSTPTSCFGSSIEPKDLVPTLQHLLKPVLPNQERQILVIAANALAAMRTERTSLALLKFQERVCILTPENTFVEAALTQRGHWKQCSAVVDLLTQNLFAMLRIAPKHTTTPAEIQDFFEHETNIHRTLQQLSIRSIPRFYHALRTPSSDFFAIITEFFPEGDLYTKLPLAPLVSLKIFHSVAMAVNDLHANEYVHGDIKPENILLKRNAQKQLIGALTDFDNTNKTNQTKWGGSINYLAPELRNSSSRSHPSYQSDIWSFGVTIFVTLVPADAILRFIHSTLDDLTRPLTRDETLSQFIYDQLRSHMSSALRENESLIDPVANLLSDMMSINPENRPSAETVLTTIETILSQSEDFNIDA